MHGTHARPDLRLEAVSSRPRLDQRHGTDPSLISPYPRYVEAGYAVHASLTPTLPPPQPVCNSMDDAVAAGSLLDDGIYSATS